MAARAVVVVAGGGGRPARAAGPRCRPVRPVVAADSGVDVAIALGLGVDVVVGDLDSVTRGRRSAAAEAAGARIVRHPVAKDATDLALALEEAERPPRRPRRGASPSWSWRSTAAGSTTCSPGSSRSPTPGWAALDASAPTSGRPLVHVLHGPGRAGARRRRAGRPASRCVPVGGPAERRPHRRAPLPARRRGAARRHHPRRQQRRRSGSPPPWPRRRHPARRPPRCTGGHLDDPSRRHLLLVALPRRGARRLRRRRSDTADTGATTADQRAPRRPWRPASASSPTSPSPSARTCSPPSPTRPASRSSSCWGEDAGSVVNQAVLTPATPAGRRALRHRHHVPHPRPRRGALRRRTSRRRWTASTTSCRSTTSTGSRRSTWATCASTTTGRSSRPRARRRCPRPSPTSTDPAYRDLLVVAGPGDLVARPRLPRRHRRRARRARRGRSTGRTCGPTASRSPPTGPTPTTASSPAARPARATARSSSPTRRARRPRCVFADPPVDEPPTGVIEGTCVRQVEYAGVLAGAEHPDAARAVHRLPALARGAGRRPADHVRLPGRSTASPLPDVFERVRRPAAEPIVVDPFEFGERARRRHRALERARPGLSAGCTSARGPGCSLLAGPGGVPRRAVRLAGGGHRRHRTPARRGSGQLGDALDAVGRHLDTIAFTGWQAALSTAVTFALALPGAWALARFRFPGRAARPRAGRRSRSSCRRWWWPPRCAASSAPAGSSPVGSCSTSRCSPSSLAHAFFNYAVVVWIVGERWGHLDRRVEEAARMLGRLAAGRVLRRVTLPLLAPSVLAAAVLVFLFSPPASASSCCSAGPEHATVEVAIARSVGAAARPPGGGGAVAAPARSPSAPCSSCTAACATAPAARSRQAPARPRRPAARRRSGERLARRRPSSRRSCVFLGAPLLVLVERSFRVGDGYGLDWYRGLSRAGRDSTLFVPPLEAVRTSLGLRGGRGRDRRRGDRPCCGGGRGRPAATGSAGSPTRCWRCRSACRP